MRINKYFTIAAVALALVACDKNNDDFNIDNTKDTPSPSLRQVWRS